jgi:hypothetical protein
MDIQDGQDKEAGERGTDITFIGFPGFDYRNDSSVLSMDRLLTL